MIKGIEHIGLAAKDVHKLADWYCDMFGMKVVLSTASGAVFIQSQNGVTIEVYKARSDAGGDYYASGLRHIAIDVQDIRGERARLAARGLAIDAEVASNPGFRLVRFVDPEGNHGHLVERDTAL
jgi:catechol 2,3-dioxygenase-like lactoylglutathione lyase family enzyme